MLLLLCLQESAFPSPPFTPSIITWLPYQLTSCSSTAGSFHACNFLAVLLSAVPRHCKSYQTGLWLQYKAFSHPPPLNTHVHGTNWCFREWRSRQSGKRLSQKSCKACPGSLLPVLLDSLHVSLSAKQ